MQTPAPGTRQKRHRFPAGAANGDEAFTGLEAAIILIAFIVVASVFSFVVLGSGFFATQKSQEVIHAGIEQSGNALALGGTVVCQGDPSGGKVGKVEINLETASKGTGVDMTRVSYRIALHDVLLTIPPGDPKIEEIVWRYRKDSNTILEAGELVAVKLDLSTANIAEGDTFTVEIIPDTGVALALTRTAPPDITANDYYELI
ncbi:archaellin/type IV pilin N-terminal domain-containing protein [Methanoculleus taiwanensis]|uniref:archaellin/type IV pilin N-terminal domain-containing protein n=1 Tax=Methanoculleus taiwanensis TaxID=1550565 RepID=UPI000FFE69B4|nr:archaellin/type IV pilin N-terminal domain-containing protein [Methanoculleus taiwanensis]